MGVCLCVSMRLCECVSMGVCVHGSICVCVLCERVMCLCVSLCVCPCECMSVSVSMCVCVHVNAHVYFSLLGQQLVEVVIHLGHCLKHRDQDELDEADLGCGFGHFVPVHEWGHGEAL